MNKKQVAIFATALAATATASAATIGKVVVNQMWPWSTKVAIDYELNCNPGETWDVSLSVKDANNEDVTGLSNAISGDTDNVSGGAHRLVWDPGRSFATGSAPVLSYTLSLSEPLGKKYMIVDLTKDANGKFSVSYLDEEPEGGFNTDTYKQTKIVFRRCRAGSFVMGSPDAEVGHDVYLNGSTDATNPNSEKQRQVTLSKDFYMGIFELTVRQARAIWPDYYGYTSRQGATYLRRALFEIRPCHIRGATNATPASVAWASTANVDPTSLIGAFRASIPDAAQVPGYVFDVPTEAQWEYACRAGTTNVWNNDGSWSPADSYGGNNYVDMDVKTGENADNVLRFLGKYRYDYDAETGHFKWDQSQSTNVGRYQPNAWGLYDMHGNVAELCLDGWVNPANYDGSAMIDPLHGTGSVQYIVARGGSWQSNARECRAAARSWTGANTASMAFGVRLALVPERPAAP